MNKYEALVIFNDTVKDTDWDNAVTSVRNEIKKVGGEVDSATRLGKRTFARPMQKQESGFYGLIAFRMAGDKIPALQARFKLNETIFRTQIVKAPAHPPAPVKIREEGDEGVGHGIPE